MDKRFYWNRSEITNKERSMQAVAVAFMFTIMFVMVLLVDD